MLIRKYSHNSGDTFIIGQALARFCRPGTNVLINGDLAAGKTVFAKGLGAGLGVTGNIKSPSYTLMCSYEGDNMPFFHFDAYNLAGMDDFYALGFDEFLYNEGVTVIEWGSVLGDAFPEEYIHVDIEKGEGEDERIITLTSQGDQPEEILKEWQNNEDISL